jgi:hypothetical protein
MRYAIFTLMGLLAAIMILAPTSATADAKAYRTVRSQRYEILEAKAIYIYSTNILVRKGALEKVYYFRAGPTGEIRPLTILNLKKAFPDNHKFHNSLDMMFRSDSSLNGYDDFHKMFTVNRLLIGSEQ